MFCEQQISRMVCQYYYIRDDQVSQLACRIQLSLWGHFGPGPRSALRLWSRAEPRVARIGPPGTAKC